MTQGIVILNPNWIDGQTFADQEIIEINPSEPTAANVLRIGDVIVSAAAYPQTMPASGSWPPSTPSTCRSWRRPKERSRAAASYSTGELANW